MTSPLSPSLNCSSKLTPFSLKPSISLTTITTQQPLFLKRNSTLHAIAMHKHQTPIYYDPSPPSFLRHSDGSDPSSSIRTRFESMIRDVQDKVCEAIETTEGGAKFKEDTWTRPGGGGGISRVLQDGAVWEKAGVNASVVYGEMLPEAYRSATGDDHRKPGPVPFFAAGISSVLHPKNPFAPTMHFNFRYFETDTPAADVAGAPRKWWFGGGTDLTPAYLFEEDARHFHRIQKNACDKYDPMFYPKFKKRCEEYFYIKHRGERRGVGGIFFDDLNEYDQEMLLSFATECANSVVPSYIPIIEKRKDMAFNERHKAWQQLRRGRYVEFNLVYDRGTTFGLQTGGRVESILVSMPLTARWEYDHQPELGTEEWKLLDACINPKEWC